MLNQHGEIELRRLDARQIVDSLDTRQQIELAETLMEVPEVSRSWRDKVGQIARDVYHKQRNEEKGMKKDSNEFRYSHSFQDPQNV